MPALAIALASPRYPPWRDACLRHVAVTARSLCLAACLAAALTTLLAANACGETTCSCVNNFAQLDVSPAVASAVTGSRVAGKGCELRCYDADFRAVEAGAPQACAIYTLTKSERGTCEVTIDFTGGTTFTRNVSFVPKGTDDCCGGIYPEKDSRIVVSK